MRVTLGQGTLSKIWYLHWDSESKEKDREQFQKIVTKITRQLHNGPQEIEQSQQFCQSSILLGQNFFWSKQIF